MALSYQLEAAKTTRNLPGKQAILLALEGANLPLTFSELRYTFRL